MYAEGLRSTFDQARYERDLARNAGFFVCEVPRFDCAGSFDPFESLLCGSQTRNPRLGMSRGFDAA